MKLLACTLALAAFCVVATARPASVAMAMGPMGPVANEAHEAHEVHEASAPADGHALQVEKPTESETVGETAAAPSTNDVVASQEILPVKKRHDMQMEKRADHTEEQQQQQTAEAAPSKIETPAAEEKSHDENEMSDSDMSDLLEYLNQNGEASAEYEEDGESRKKRSVSESSMSAVAAAERKKRSVEEVPVERKKRSLDEASETAAEHLLEQVRMLEMREALKRRLEEEMAEEDESSSDEDDEVQKRSDYEERPRSMLIRVAGEPGLFVPLDALQAEQEEDDDESSSASESSEEDAPIAKRGYGYETDDNSDESESEDSAESSEEDEDRKKELLRELILQKMRDQEVNAMKRSYYEDDSSDSDDSDVRKRAYDEGEDDYEDDSEERRDLVREYMVLDSLARALVDNRQK